ncbi:hypothetical protein EDC94DRAFT_604779, partial [Helicostylum pulchrum]
MKVLFLIALFCITIVLADVLLPPPPQQEMPTSTITITETSFTTLVPTATGSIITSNDALRLFTMKSSSSVAAVVVLAYLVFL